MVTQEESRLLYKKESYHVSDIYNTLEIIPFMKF